MLAKPHVVLLSIVFFAFCNLLVAVSVNADTQPVFDTSESTAPSPPKANEDLSKWRFLSPFVADYHVFSEGERLGSAQRQLQLEAQKWKLSSNASISKYFLKVKSSEYTKFSINDDELLTQQFSSKTKITFKKAKTMNQSFDWKSGTESGNRGKKKWQLSHSKPVFDRVSHLVQLRSDLLNKVPNFEYSVSYKGKVHKFKYIIEATENLETDMGAFETIKLVRTKANGDVFKVWLSPQLNYFPVQIAQFEIDKPDVTMQLKSLDYSAEPTKQ